MNYKNYTRQKCDTNGYDTFIVFSVNFAYSVSFLFSIKDAICKELIGHLLYGYLKV